MIFVESPWFDGWREGHLDDEAFRRLQGELLADPERGDVIRGSGGLRKLRVAVPGRGRRGGARVIYFYWVRHDRIYLLFAYDKNVQGDLTPEQLRRLSAVMSEEQDDE